MGHIDYGYVVAVTRRLSRGRKLCRRVQPYEAEITNHLNFQQVTSKRCFVAERVRDFLA